MKLTEIAKGWANLAMDRNKELALQRLEKCDGCSHKVQLSPVGAVLVTSVNSESSTYYCDMCGCPLAALTRSADSACKAGKWGPASYY